MRIAVVTPIMRSGEKGGAEAFFQGLVGSLRNAGHDTDQIEVVIDESTFEAVLESYQACHDLDLHEYDLVISTKAPTYMVRHPRHVVYLVHTIRVFYDMFDREYPSPSPEQYRQRAMIHRLDQHGLHPDRIRRYFAIGREPFQRLYDADSFWRQIPFQTLHLPPTLTDFREPRAGEYIFLPGRIHRWKRGDLVVKAFRQLRADIPLKIAGTGEDEPVLRELAAGDPRIEFLGRVSDDELLDLYAGALVVPFVPIHEDYGLITLEAFRSQKPVLTCRDSGEPTFFVRDGETGFVTEPEPEAIAARLEWLIEHPDRAAEMGRRGCQSVAHINWESIAETLIASVEEVSSPARSSQYSSTKKSAASMDRVQAAPAPGGATADDGRRTAAGDPDESIDTTGQPGGRVCVLDMQPIDPPVGGGRLRLLGLYHALGSGLRTTYIGSYDWPGPSARHCQLSPTLEEIDVPLSPEHFRINDSWTRFAGGRTIIDSAFPLMAQHSDQYCDAVRTAVSTSDVVVFSHPWVYPLVQDLLDDERQVIVYDAQNFEGMLRAELLDDDGFGTEIVKHVATTEYELAHRADLVLTCSAEDSQLFAEVYGVATSKLRETPNGVFVDTVRPPSLQEKAEAAASFGLTGASALFLGSNYGPNVEAVEFIRDRLAPAMPGVTFLICGGVASAFSDGAAGGPPNLRWYPSIDEETKLRLLRAADVAINPMFSGSGTNIKMFEFMAAGLPVLATPVGARGIESESGRPFLVADAVDFPRVFEQLLQDDELLEQLRTEGRQLVEREFAWERISPDLGRTLAAALSRKRTRPERSPVSTQGDGVSATADATAQLAMAPRAVEPIQDSRADTPRRLAVLTSWSTACGIAEHSRHLIESLRAHAVECWLPVVGRDSYRCVPALTATDRIEVEDLWQCQHVEVGALVRSLRAAGISVLSVQHHTGFFREGLLLDIGRACRAAGIDVLVALHDPKNVSPDTLIDLVATGAKVIVHNRDEQRRLVSSGVAEVSYLPLGVLDVPDEPASTARERLACSGSPVLGAFGFLRRHKGLLELIEATASLRELYPEVQLLALAAAHPADDSQRYLAECQQRIVDLDLVGHVRLDTQFREIADVVRDLHACDVIVLPYHPSNEGASASVNVALAARRPVITSRSEIFRPVWHATYKVSQIAPPVLAAGIATVLASPLLQQSLKCKSEQHVASNSWSTVAGEYFRLAFAPEQGDGSQRVPATAARPAGPLTGQPALADRASAASSVVLR